MSIVDKINEKTGKSAAIISEAIGNLEIGGGGGAVSIVKLGTATISFSENSTSGFANVTLDENYIASIDGKTIINVIVDQAEEGGYSDSGSRITGASVCVSDFGSKWHNIIAMQLDSSWSMFKSGTYVVYATRGLGKGTALVATNMPVNIYAVVM